MVNFRPYLSSKLKLTRNIPYPLFTGLRIQPPKCRTGVVLHFHKTKDFYYYTILAVWKNINVNGC